MSGEVFEGDSWRMVNHKPFFMPDIRLSIITGGHFANDWRWNRLAQEVSREGADTAHHIPVKEQMVKELGIDVDVWLSQVLW